MAFPLHAAAEEGNVAEIQRLLSGAPTDVNERNAQKCAPLHLAARGGHVDAARALLGAGADFAARGESGRSAFIESARFGKLEAARFFLERGAAVDERCDYQRTALIYAAGRGHIDMLSFLLERGADKEAKDGEQKTALHWTASMGQADASRALVAAGAEVNARDAGNSTPLHCATMERHVDVARVLLEAGADATAFNKDAAPYTGHGMCALFYATARNNLELVRLLVEHGADTEHRFEGGWRAIEHAAASGFLDIVKYLAEKGSDITNKAFYEQAIPKGANRKNYGLRTPLHFAMEHQQPEERRAVATWLIENGADIDAVDQSGKTPLMFAANFGDAEIVKLLLAKGADMAATGKRGETVFECAVISGSVDVLRAMEEAGYKPPQEVLDAALRSAADVGRRAMVKELLARGADVHTKSGNSRYTPLLLACRTGDIELVKILLEAGADAKDRSATYITPLMEALAPQSGSGDEESQNPKVDLELIRLLVDRGCDVNGTTNSNETALHRAAALEDPGPCLYLLEKGAKVHVHGDNGGTPATVAASHGRLELLKALLDAEERQARPDDAEEGSPLAGAVRGKHRDVIRFLLERDAERAARPGHVWPKLARGDRQSKIRGRGQGYVKLMNAGVEMNDLEYVRAGADWLLMCTSSVVPEDFEEAEKAAAAAERAAAKGILTAAKRLAGVKKQAAAEGGAATAPLPAGDTPLILACRHGLRATAARLAAAAADVDARNGAGETALFHCVRAGRPLLDVALLLIQRGADLTLRLDPSGKDKRRVLDATTDLALKAELKRAAGIRDVLLSYDEQSPPVAAFARVLRDRLEEQHITCWMNEGGKAATTMQSAQALVLIVTPGGCESPVCRGELAAAKNRQAPVFPVWRQQCPLDDQMKGSLLRQQFADFSTDALFEAGFPAFAHTVSQAINAPGGAGGDAGGAADAAALLAMPEARCALGEDGGHVVLWCSPKDAAFARALVLALRDRGLACWVLCQVPGRGAAPESAAEDTRAVVSCRAFVPLLSGESIGDGGLRDALQLAEVSGRPARPAVLSAARVPGSGGAGPDRLPFAFLTEGNVAFFSSLDALLASCPLRGGGAPPAPAPASAPPPAQQPAAAAAAPTEAALAARRAELEQVQRAVAGMEEELRRLRAAAASGATPRAATTPAGAAANSKACSVQ